MSRTKRRHTSGRCDQCARTAFCLRRLGSRSLCAACLSIRHLVIRDSAAADVA